MKKKKEDNYYTIAGFIGFGSSILIHWLFISRFPFHPTIHVLIAISFLFVIAGTAGIILEKFSKK